MYPISRGRARTKCGVPSVFVLLKSGEMMKREHTFPRLDEYFHYKKIP